MILPLLVALQTPMAAPNPAADRPIRIWMDPSGPVSRGRSVRLYVQAGAAGNLVVLHSRTDGRIEVLFPARPTDDPHLTPGTWELRGRGDAPVWTVSEPDGSGMILAALSPDPIWFDEFSRDAVWSPDALRPSWSGADAMGGMQDIVQRMLGDGAFTYDVLTYTVAPEMVAQAPQAFDDTFPTYNTIQHDSTCDVSSPVECQLLGQPLFFGRRFHHRRFAPRPTPGSGSASGSPQGVAFMVLPVRPVAPTAPSSGPVVPRRRMIPDAPVRRRSPAAAPASPAAQPGLVRTLRPRPVTGAEEGRLAGAAPAARSALVLRYVHAPVVPRAAPAGPRVALVPAAAVGAPPRPAAPVGTVAAALPVRIGGVMLMSRAVSPRAAAGVTRNSPQRPSPVAARSAPPPAASRTGGTVGGWIVIPRRR